MAGARVPQAADDPISALPPVMADEAEAVAAPLTHLESLPGGSISRQVWVLALPMLGEQIGSFLVGMVDVWLAGWLSKEATGAVGTGGYMSWFTMLAFTLVSTGAAALVARCFGARDFRTAKRALNQSLVLALLLGVPVSVLVYVLAPPMADLFSQTDAARGLFTTYVRIDALGYAAFGALLICGAVLRAAGDTRSPMLIMLAVNVLNPLVSAALVFGWLGLPRLGVTGIALGTVAARWLGGGLIILVLARGLHGLRLEWRELWPDAAILRRILRVGLPAAGDAGLLWAGQLFFLLIIVHTATGDASTVNYAAHMIAMRMEAISYLPAVAWATAGATLVGQYLGAGSKQLAARSGHVAALQTAGLTTLIGLSFFTLAELIFRGMSNDPAVWAVGTPAFRLLAFIQPFLGVAIVYTAVLRGAGDTRVTMVFSLIGSFLLRIPVAYLCGIVLGGGLIGAWIGMWADNLAKCLLGLGRFLHGGWQRVKV